MISSELKYKITLQAPVKSNDGYGTNQEISYVDTIIDIWAGIRYIGGNKSVQNYELFTSQILQFKIRDRDDFDESWRVKYNNKIYQILNLDPYGGYEDNLLITAELLQ